MANSTNCSSFGMFPGSRNVTINGGNFTYVQICDTADDNSGFVKSDFHSVLDNVDTTALHDSIKRRVTRKGVPGQYENILRIATDWAGSSQVRERMLWVHGPFFTHAIAHSAANIQEQNHVALVTYFVDRFPDNERVLTRFISTIVYQLCLSVPKLREEIERIVAYDPIILSRSLTRQLDSLILQPLTPHFSANNQQSPVVIIVDGYNYLDQFTQACIFDVLVQFSQRLPVHVRILVFTESSAGKPPILTSAVENGSVKEINFDDRPSHLKNKAKYYLSIGLRALLRRAFRILKSRSGKIKIDAPNINFNTLHQT